MDLPSEGPWPGISPIKLRGREKSKTRPGQMGLREATQARKKLQIGGSSLAARSWL